MAFAKMIDGPVAGSPLCTDPVEHAGIPGNRANFMSVIFCPAECATPCAWDEFDKNTISSKVAEHQKNCCRVNIDLPPSEQALKKVTIPRATSPVDELTGTLRMARYYRPRGVGMVEEEVRLHAIERRCNQSHYPIWISGGTSGFINDAPPSA